MTTNLKHIMLDTFNNSLYKERLNTLKTKELKDYIVKRNKAFEKGTLTKFIKNARKEDKYYKLTPPIIYYGEN